MSELERLREFFSVEGERFAFERLVDAVKQNASTTKALLESQERLAARIAELEREIDALNARIGGLT